MCLLESRPLPKANQVNVFFSVIFLVSLKTCYILKSIFLNQASSLCNSADKHILKHPLLGRKKVKFAKLLYCKRDSSRKPTGNIEHNKQETNISSRHLLSGRQSSALINFVLF